MTDKKCPRCPEEVLIQHRYERQELGLCRTCGGLWFDKDEINEVILAKNPDIELSCFRESFGQSLGQSHSVWSSSPRGLLLSLHWS